MAWPVGLAQIRVPGERDADLLRRICAVGGALGAQLGADVREGLSAEQALLLLREGWWVQAHLPARPATATGSRWTEAAEGAQDPATFCLLYRAVLAEGLPYFPDAGQTGREHQEEVMVHRERPLLSALRRFGRQGLAAALEESGIGASCLAPYQEAP